MALAVYAAAKFEIIVSQGDAAAAASKATWVEFFREVGLQVFSFDATVARLAHRVVESMIVALTVWGIVENVKVCSQEWSAAGLAHETLELCQLMVHINGTGGRSVHSLW